MIVNLACAQYYVLGELVMIENYPKFFLGFGLYVLGHIFAWFQLNSQFIWDWWQDRPMTAVLIFAVPVGLSFWFATHNMYEAMNELWGPRLVAFGASYLVFPILTWYFANESMFTPKTLTCIFLSFLIVTIQLFWK